MTSTLDDFAAFYQMHANGGTYRGRRILSEKAVAEMHTRQGKLDLLMAGPYGNDYGLAFFLDRLDDPGRPTSSPTPGYFGTTPWLDDDRELVGVLFVQSNFLRIMPLVHRSRTRVRRSCRSARTARRRPHRDSVDRRGHSEDRTASDLLSGPASRPPIPQLPDSFSMHRNFT